MRRIFPLKSGPASTNNHGQSGGSLQKETTAKPKAGTASRHPPEVSKRIPARTKKTEASTSEEVTTPTVRGKREHWCPACPAPENGVRCDTPPSGDENLGAKEVEKGVISPSTDSPRLLNRRSQRIDLRDDQDLDLDESLLVGSMRGADCSVASVDKYTTKRSGLGSVDNVMHQRGAKPAVSKTKAPQQAECPSPRSNSAPKVRPLSRVSQPEVARLHSMRIMRVPDRVFESSQSSESPRVSEGSSSTENGTPRSRAIYERQKSMLPPVKTHAKSPSQSDSVGSRGSDRPPISSPSFNLRKLSSDTPRTARKELVTSARAESPDKGQTKYSGARVVAERLAKAFRGTSKTAVKEVAKTTVNLDRSASRRATPGQSKRIIEQPDVSYDGSCSEASLQAGDDGVSLVNVLQLVRPGERLSRSSSRKESAGTEENGMTWEEFVSDAKAPEGLLNDNPTPERIGESKRITSYQSNAIVNDSKAWFSPVEDKNLIRPTPVSSPRLQEEKEREVLKAWLGGLKRQSEGMSDDLEMKARMADQRISVLNGEQSLFDDQLDFLRDLQFQDDSSKSNLAAGITIMQQRIRRMHEEKKRLALEVASEVKRRITERAAAKEVLVMMKREMEACVRVMEKEKLGVQAGLERELERRENEWCSKLESIKLEEKWLRERVRRLEEEKVLLQSDFSAVSSKEGSLREKVREFELQMEGHRKRVEGAEKTILDLRQSLVSSCQQSRQAELDLETVRKAFLEKEALSQDLATEVSRLQQLRADHETSIEGLQKGLKNGISSSSDVNETVTDAVKEELIRLSKVEQTLREDLQFLRSEAVSLQVENKMLAERLGNGKGEGDIGDLDDSLHAELTSLQLRAGKLQEENNLLTLNLQHSLAENESGKELLKSLDSTLSNVEKDRKALQEDAVRERNRIQEKEREIHRLERRVDGLLKNNQMLQGILAMREKAALISEEEAKEKENAVKEAHQLESEMRESLQVSARQLSFMNERAELMSEKLQERDGQLAAVKSESGKKDEAILSLEQSHGDLCKKLDTQNRRIMQLTSKNAELSRYLQTRGKEVEDLHTKIVEDSQIRTDRNQDNQISEQAHDVKQELEAQNLLCKLLRDKLVQREDDLTKKSEDFATLVRSRDWLQVELKRAQGSLGEASQRLATLERTVRQKDEILSGLKAEKDNHVRDLSKLRERLPQVECERDAMQVEAEDIGREALRLSAEVEVLRRRVAQLEEDVLLKEGQISILRGSCFGGSE